MDIQEARKIVEKIKYKKDWHFSLVLELELDCLLLRIYHLSINSDHPEIDKKEPINGQFSISSDFLKQLKEKEFVEWIRTQVLFMETHETDEWLRYEGMNVKDPHPDLSALKDAMSDHLNMMNDFLKDRTIPLPPKEKPKRKRYDILPDFFKQKQWWKL